ncbi:hypothetical protein DPX16_13146 [Anabarilius grahami]|uniref:Uncharacterized protein n=1 Tax=Anabarilius grahami TaxID=495550 RepID=A0A3N0YNH6_ANAGA|nr:hypothetical protein DPX16_13146 [Anabarilius grahami]
MKSVFALVSHDAAKRAVCSGPETREHRVDHMRESAQTTKGCGERITVISLSRMHFALPQTAQLFFGMLMENKSSKPRVVVLRASHNRKAESPSTQPVRLVLATRTPLL